MPTAGPADSDHRVQLKIFVGAVVHSSSMDQLPNEIAATSGGRWQVTTLTSTYLLDMDEAWAVRVPHGGAVRRDDGTLLISYMFNTDGQPLTIHEVIEVRVGHPLRLQVVLPDGQTVPLRSTPIRRIAAIRGT